MIDLKVLTSVQKYNLYNVADRSAQLIAIRNLYRKPTFIDSFSFNDIFLLKDCLFMNYLLTKLEFMNKFKYMEYIYSLKNLRDLKQINFLNIPKYIINDLKIYNILYNKISFNELNIEWSESILSSPMVSIVNKLDFYLKPLVYQVISDKELKELNDPNDIIEYAEIVLAKENIFDNIFDNNLELKKESIQSNKLPLKSEMTYLKYLHQEEAAFKYYTPLYEKFDNTDLIMEEFLSLHINFENHNTMFLLIDINQYTVILKSLSLSVNQIKFYLNLANQYNEIISKCIKIKNIEYFTFKDSSIINPSIKFSIGNVKEIELSNSLKEFNIYTEYSLKTIIEFIELFLFKFEFVFTISIDQLLDLFYKGIESQIIFFEFYNLLIGEFNKLKYNMTFTTISYIIEFLEFLYLLADVGGFTPDFFERPVYTILNHVSFKNLRLFRFNFYTKFKHFKFNNNSIKLNNYYQYQNYMKKLLNPLILNFKIDSKDKDLLNSNFDIYKNFKNSKSIKFNIKKLLKIFLYLDKVKYLKGKLSIYKKYVYKRSRKVKFHSLLYFKSGYIKSTFKKLNVSMSKFKKLSANLPLSNLPILKYVNLYRLKEMALFKDLLKRYMSKRNKNNLKNNINQLKHEIVDISVQMNKIRLLFFKSIISYNKNNKNKPLLLDNINFYNLSPGIQPSSNESLISNINDIGKKWLEQSTVLISLNNNLGIENDKK